MVLAAFNTMILQMRYAVGQAKKGLSICQKVKAGSGKVWPAGQIQPPVLTPLPPGCAVWPADVAGAGRHLRTRGAARTSPSTPTPRSAPRICTRAQWPRLRTRAGLQLYTGASAVGTCWALSIPGPAARRPGSDDLALQEERRVCWHLASLRHRGKLGRAVWAPPRSPPLLQPAPGPSPRVGHRASGRLQRPATHTDLPTSQDQPRGQMGQRVAALSLSFHQNLQTRLRFAS